MSDIYLSDSEVQVITGKVQGAAQRRVLDKMGYSVKVRPDGTFWVPRSQFIESKPAKAYALNFGALDNGQAA